MSLEIAKVIQSQLNAGKDASGKTKGTYCQMCWGVSKRMFLPASKTHDGGLVLVVNGRFHKGQVHILLAKNDTYTIKFFKRDNCVYSTEGIYYDQLTEIIDSYVESNLMGHHKNVA